MLLTLIVILILIWSAVVWSLYSNFLVFYENFSETENYHKARYAAVAAMERAELVIKQRQPWFEGEWWRIRSVNKAWSDSDTMPSGTGFSYLSQDSSHNSTVYRTIKSQTSRIPSTWDWNVEKLLSAEDSPDYNMMDYENAEVFLLYYDKGDYDHPYTKKTCPWDCQKTKLSSIKVAIRLPSYIRSKFWEMGKAADLDINSPLLQDGWFPNDAIVDRQVRWTDDNIPTTFTIFATQDAMWYSTGPNDSAIRESHLNNLSWLTFNFSDKWNPITDKTTPPTIISSQDATISWESQAFKHLFTKDRYQNLQLRLSLLNLVLWWWKAWNRYPFLEYYIDIKPTWTNPVIASDRYYTIETEWNFWDYKINNVIYKPTITESILRSFTTIF